MDAELTDDQWEVIRPLIPAQGRMGRPRADDRQVLNGILFVLKSGCRWKDMPRQFSYPSTCWRRLKRWEEQGVWDNIFLALLTTLNEQERLEWDRSFPEGSFAPAKRGQAVGLTRKGKGTKWMVVTDENGLPLVVLLDSTQKAEIKLSEKTMSLVWVPKNGPGRPKTRPKELVADRGYDSKAFRI
jgi:transposase